MIGHHQLRGACDWTVIGQGVLRAAALWGRHLRLHGAVAILMFIVSAIFTVFAVASERRAGDDTKFSCPFPILSIVCRASSRLRGDASPVVIRDVHKVAPVAAIAWRERSLAFDSAQHDQVDAASIPALVCQVTMEKKGGLKMFIKLLLHIITL